MNDFTVFLIIIYVVLESFEIFSQKASTLMGMFAKLYVPYKKSLAYFMALHPSYMFALYLLVYSDFSIEAIALVILKSLDIGLKIQVLQHIFEKQDLSEEITMALLQKINPILYTINFLVYLPLVVFALYPYDIFSYM